MDFSKKPERANPRKGANPLSQLFFLWMTPVFWKGTRKGLNTDDLTHCLRIDESEVLGDELERYETIICIDGVVICPVVYLKTKIKTILNEHLIGHCVFARMVHVYERMIHKQKVVIFFIFSITENGIKNWSWLKSENVGRAYVERCFECSHHISFVTVLSALYSC